MLKNIFVAEHGGFCFGVSRAVRTVEENLGRGPLCTFGQIIHNPQVVERFEEQGVRVISRPEEAPPGASVVIRSHGVTPDVIAGLEAAGLRVLNATCPHVLHIQQIARTAHESGKRVFIVGDAAHPEVVGISGWCGGAAEIIGSVEEAEQVRDDGREACVVAQTGTTREKWETVTAALKERVARLEAVNTICNATATRQKEARELAARVDVMLVIGGANSFNTGKLAEACREVNKRTYSVERIEDLKAVVIKSGETLGITAGASTPEWLIKEVKAVMSEMDKNENQTNWLEEFEKQEKIRTGSVVTGEIVALHDDDMFLNIGYKTDALLPASEAALEEGKTLRDVYSVGDQVTAEVVKLNDGEGNVLLSRRKMEEKGAWENIEKAFQNNESVTVKVKEAVKGGLVGFSSGVRVFIPASQVGLGFENDLTKYVGQELQVRILETGENNKRRVIASRKALLKEEEDAKKKAALERFEVNMIVAGTVKRMTSFGAFVDIGDIDGLLHITDMAWYRLTSPKQVLSVGQQIECVILAIDKEAGKVSLGYKQLQPRLWDNIFDRYPIGSVVTGTVARVVSFGAFVSLEPGIDGLVHVSQLTNKFVKNPADVVTPGQEVQALVMDVDPEAKRISLSMKALLADAPAAEEAPAEEKPAAEEATEA
ncbi:MAG: bifunctional 4-hydroxy-3-methylbut-2-enyl diphosphate reductase/30S ribosomal protein S1 [Eubacteriales bacterium]|nr:bifunctional 4-hydroxy-3-methylbut-2-enyl diphosphate reductase/30S ribosomal protein S1 [Eubacteriales bacterium]